MKNIFKAGLAIVASALVATSCKLDFAPEDFFGSGTFWTSEANVKTYIIGMHKHMRDADEQRTILLGEARSGMYRLDASSDGNICWGAPFSNLAYDKDNPGLSNFGNLYGRITNVLLFIQEVTNADYLTQDQKDLYLALGYGLRAFYYFDLYRNYGAVPLRLTPDVVNGEIDPTKLYMARTYPKDVMAQIVSDIENSLTLYGDNNSFDPYGLGGNKGYWTKAASEALAADIYMWHAKVSTPWIDPETGEDGGFVADPSTMAKAKTCLENLRDNYGLALQDDFAKVFDAYNKGNSEVIFAIRYLEGEAQNRYMYCMYNMITGNMKNNFDRDGNLWGNKMDLNIGYGGAWYEFDTTLFKFFTDDDDRRDNTILENYVKREDKSLKLAGTCTVKNIGYKNAQGNSIFCGDQIYWRLAGVYLGLAEVANFEGNNADVEKYMNLVRDRAYGVGVNDYTAADYTTNELAILAERTKEFVQEGQRWWDLCRMTTTKGGEALVFNPAAGLDGVTPVLTQANKHKLLLPLNISLLGNDPSLVQTPGY